MIVIGSAVSTFLWGVAFANIIQGTPIHSDFESTGTLVTLLNPYGLLDGATTLLLFFTHGVQFVALKTDGELRERARALALRAGLVTIAVDAETGARVLAGMGALAAEGALVVVVTHRPAVIAAADERLALAPAGVLA